MLQGTIFMWSSTFLNWAFILFKFFNFSFEIWNVHNCKKNEQKKKKIEGHCDSIIYTFTERERKVKMHLLSSTSSSVPRLHLLVTMVSSGLLTTQGSHWKNIWITIICSSGPHDDIPKEITSFSEWPVMISCIVFWDNAVFITLFTSIPIQT